MSTQTERPMRKSEAPRASEAPAPKVTLVEAGTVFKGSFDSNCAVLVRGKIEGEVTAPKLTVHENGVVKGKAIVGELSSDGELEGAFEAESARLSGRVRDNTVVRAATIEVELVASGGTKFGTCDLEVGEMPRREDVLASHGVAPRAAASAEKVDRVDRVDKAEMVDPPKAELTAATERSVSPTPVPNAAPVDGGAPEPVDEAVSADAVETEAMPTSEELDVDSAEEEIETEAVADDAASRRRRRGRKKERPRRASDT